MATIGLDILQAQRLLKAGELVAIPTETVYGLAGNAYSEEAVLRIFSVKQRPSFDPLIVHASCIERIEDFVKDLPTEAQQLAQHFWPGPLTLLLKKQASIPDTVTAGLPRVAVRIPSHQLTLRLLQALPFPLAAPSANPFGYISPTTPQHVNNQLGNQIPYILAGGACSIGIESTIVGFEQGKPMIYRLGGISVEAIEQVIGPVTVADYTTTSPQAPGTLVRHYSPQKRLVVGDIPELIKQYSHQRIGVLAFDQYHTNIDPKYQVMLAPSARLEEAAQNLFAALRQLDQLPIDLILAARVPHTGIGRAIHDRLRRAASNNFIE